MKHIIKKADIVLFFALILLGAVLTLAPLVSGEEENGAKVVIHVEGKVYGTYSLSKDQTITIDENDHHNLVIIESGKVRMEESNCDNQTCVHQGAIDSSFLPIVCLPNRVMVQIVDGEEAYDAISQ